MFEFLASLTPWAALVLLLGVVAYVSIRINPKIGAAIAAVGLPLVAWMFGRSGGKRDEKERIEQETTREENRIRETGAEARARADARNRDPERLRDDDGFRRDS